MLLRSEPPSPLFVKKVCIEHTLPEEICPYFPREISHSGVHFRQVFECQSCNDGEVSMKRSALFPWWIWMLALLLVAACTAASSSPSPSGPVTLPPVTETAPPVVLATTEPSPTFTPAPTATEAQPEPTTGNITGMVWEDRCPATGENCREVAEFGRLGDGTRQPEEILLAGVAVSLAKGACPGTPISRTVTDGRGVYTFQNLEPGTYCVFIDMNEGNNALLLRGGVWTAPSVNQAQSTVDLQPGETATVDFGITRPAAQVVQASPTPPPPGPVTLPTPQATSTPSPTPTAQLATNPYELGDPDVVDNLDVPGGSWYLRWTNEATFKGKPGRLIMQVRQTGLVNFWTFSTYPPLKDAYLEGVFITGPQCRHKDRYGFIVRAPTRYEGIVFLISCDGMYKIFRWNGGLKILQDWTRSPAIHIGPNQTNRIGVWMEGKTLKLYINRALVAEIQEEIFLEGSFGVVIGADKTKDFEVYLDQVAFWLLPAKAK